MLCICRLQSNVSSFYLRKELGQSPKFAEVVERKEEEKRSANIEMRFKRITVLIGLIFHPSQQKKRKKKERSGG